MNVEKCIRRGGKDGVGDASVRVETRQVGDQVEKGKTRGENRAVALNAVELSRFGTDELRGW